MPRLHNWVELLPLHGTLEHTGQSQEFTFNTFTSCLGDTVCTGVCLRPIKCCVHHVSCSHPHTIPPSHPSPVQPLLSGWCISPFLSPHITSQLQTILLTCKKIKRNLVLHNFFRKKVFSALHSCFIIRSGVRMYILLKSFHISNYFNLLPEGLQELFSAWARA